MNHFLQSTLRAAPALALALLAPAALAQNVATVTHLSGVVTARGADGTSRLLSQSSQVRVGDTLVTEADTFVRMKFVDGADMVMRPGSQLRLTTYSYDAARPAQDKVVIDIERGGFRAVTGELGHRNQGAIVFNTPGGAVKPMGTHFGALFCSNDCGGVPTPTGKTPDNGLHVDVASGAVVVTPRLTVALPGSGGIPGAPIPPGGSTGTQTPGGTTPNPTAGPVGVSPTLPGRTGMSSPISVPNPGAGAPAPAVVLNAGQFGYLPPPQNGVQPPLVLVPPSQAVQVRMPASISQNTPSSGATNKSSDPECVVQ